MTTSENLAVIQESLAQLGIGNLLNADLVVNRQHRRGRRAVSQIMNTGSMRTEP